MEFHLSIRMRSQSSYYTPGCLLFAASQGNKAETEAILKIQPKWVDHLSDDGKNTALMNACNSAKLDVVKVIVDAGADVGIENVDGITGAMIAARRCDDEMLKYLLSSGAQVTKTKSVLHAAVIGGSKECLDAVISKCKIEDIQYQNEGFDALLFAATVGNAYAFEQLLKRDPDGIKRSYKKEKMTLLHIAAISETAKIDLIELILSQEGYDINARDLYGNTPVAVAAGEAGDVEKVKKLIVKGNADVTIQNIDGQTCLHLACMKLQSDISQPPLISDAELNKDIGNYLEIVTILLENGCSIDEPDFDGNTPEDMITDSNIKAAVLARAKKVFKETTFTVEITSDKKTATVVTFQRQTFDKLTLGLDIVPRVSGDVVPFVPHVHINQWTLDKSSKLKQLCDAFASIGAIITSVAQGSVKLNAIVPTESTFEKMKEEIESKKFRAKVSKCVTTNSMRRKATKEGSKLELKLTQNDQKGQKHCVTSDKKSEDIDHSGGEVVVEKTGVSLKIPHGAVAKGQKIKLTVSVIWEENTLL
ncbi:uncharacterized protein [Amphiura filiformis]|uniref:uncharacterized protein n=1 Tax=Amphiura filiformis TaxID=82378 RepID=UPI003B2202E3